MPSLKEPKPNEEIGVTTSSMQHVAGEVVTVTVSNPTRLNSLNTTILDELISTIASLAQRPDLRCVIVTGGPCVGSRRAFIGGADISEMKDFSNAQAARTFITKIHLACSALRNLQVPVLARVNGHALGGGLVIMAATDLRIAVPDALFGMPEVQRGVPSTVESALLPVQIGAARTRRLVLLGDTISAREAESWGLIDKVVQVDELDKAVDDWVQILLSAGPRALSAQKRLLAIWEQVPLGAAIEAGVWEWGKAFEDPGLQAEGRKMMTEFWAQNQRRKIKL